MYTIFFCFVFMVVVVVMQTHHEKDNIVFRRTDKKYRLNNPLFSFIIQLYHIFMIGPIMQNTYIQTYIVSLTKVFPLVKTLEVHWSCGVCVKVDKVEELFMISGAPLFRMNLHSLWNYLYIDCLTQAQLKKKNKSTTFFMKHLPKSLLWVTFKNKRI